jgi:hypothetical protein
MDNVLTVREANEIVARQVTDSGKAEDRSAPRLVILIHGYQTSAERAQNAYAKFATHLRAGTRDGGASLGPIWEFHWPGDHPVPPISVATFHGKIANARISGDLLAKDWLRQRHGQHVVLVAHSLGCRVALEAIRSILDAGDAWDGAHIAAVFLLAAAVPVPLCVPEGTFSASMANSAEHVFHSRSDQVLHLAFPPGAYLAGEGGPAVGRDGQPTPRWRGLHDTGLGHGKYWSSKDVASRIAEVLGRNEQQLLLSRPLPRWPPLERRPGFLRRLSRRPVAERRVA